MTPDAEIWTPTARHALDDLARDARLRDGRPALLGQIAHELATAGRALEELVRDVDIEGTCQRLEQQLARGEAEGDRTRDVLELLRHLEEKAGQEVGP